MLGSNRMMLASIFARGLNLNLSKTMVATPSKTRLLSTGLVRMQQFDRNDSNDNDDFQSRLRSMSFQSDLGSSLKEHKWDEIDLHKVNTDFYQPADSVQARPDEEVEQFRRDSAITVKMPGGDSEVPKPVLEFSETGFSPEILQMLQREGGFERPMPIQAQGWPVAMSGLDLVGIGQTGSGKTLGYLLPAFEHIRNQQGNLEDKYVTGSPIALALAPTRELAQQINQVARSYGRRMGIKTACLFGGSSKGHQIRELDQCPEFVVATPGRLIDLLQAGYVELRRCTYVVLDEADRMLDMGFEPQMRSVLSQVRPDRQMLMWSATWPEEVPSFDLTTL